MKSRLITYNNQIKHIKRFSMTLIDYLTGEAKKT